MLIDATLSSSFTDVSNNARSLEDAGYDGAWTGETTHDPFLPLLRAAETTSTFSSAPASPSPSPATR